MQRIVLKFYSYIYEWDESKFGEALAAGLSNIQQQAAANLCSKSYVSNLVNAAAFCKINWLQPEIENLMSTLVPVPE